MNWYAKYIDSGNKINILDLKKGAPKQFQVYKKIKNVSPDLLKISSLKNICSNPLSICQTLELKKLIIMVKKEKEHNIDDFSLLSKGKRIRYNSDQTKAINELNKSIDSKNFKIKQASFYLKLRLI